MLSLIYQSFAWCLWQTVALLFPLRPIPDPFDMYRGTETLDDQRQFLPGFLCVLLYFVIGLS